MAIAPRLLLIHARNLFSEAPFSLASFRRPPISSRVSNPVYQNIWEIRTGDTIVERMLYTYPYPPSSRYFKRISNRNRNAVYPSWLSPMPAIFDLAEPYKAFDQGEYYTDGLL